MTRRRASYHDPRFGHWLALGAAVLLGEGAVLAMVMPELNPAALLRVTFLWLGGAFLWIIQAITYLVFRTRPAPVPPHLADGYQPRSIHDERHATAGAPASEKKRIGIEFS